MGLDDAVGSTAQDCGCRLGLSSGGRAEAACCVIELAGHGRLTVIGKKTAALKPTAADERRLLYWFRGEQARRVM